MQGMNNQPAVFLTKVVLKQPPGCGLSDPRNRNYKSLAIGNHNFEIASFSRRNRS